MLRAFTKISFVLFLIFTLCKCIDPYIPELKPYQSLLVVEGLITDENRSYTVKLSRSIQEENESPQVINDAYVFITDENSGIINLKNTGDGKYITDSLEFRGYVGKTYVLHIELNTGELYESEPYKMEPVSEIDNVYFTRDQESSDNGSVINDGLRIYLDSRGGTNKYYRWDFEETWKFKVPNPTKFEYVTDSLILPLSDVKEYCYKLRKSSEILIYSIFEGKSDRIENQSVFFIAPEKSDRLSILYSILVKQYSVSQKEYDFWNNMKQINEKGGDIYALQPFPVVSNVHNVNNPEERVLGYFQVSAVNEKRRFISFSDVADMNLKNYINPCKRIEIEPKDYPRGIFSPPLTWDEIYEMYCITSDYSFVEPLYFQGTGEIYKLVFTIPECANCEITGIKTKPDFWIDYN